MSNLNVRVELALDEIRPFLNSDGGDIELKEIKKIAETELPRLSMQIGKIQDIATEARKKYIDKISRR